MIIAGELTFKMAAELFVDISEKAVNRMKENAIRGLHQTTWFISIYFGKWVGETHYIHSQKSVLRLNEAADIHAQSADHMLNRNHMRNR